MKRLLSLVLLLVTLHQMVLAQKKLPTFTFQDKGSLLTVQVSAPDTVDYGSEYKVTYLFTDKQAKATYRGSMWVTDVMCCGGEAKIPQRQLTFHGHDISVPSVPIYARINEKYAKEFFAAKAFLLTKGVDIDTCNMKMACQDEYMTIFSDQRGRKISIVVANKRFHDLMDCPVLYWSRESQLHNFSSKQHIFPYYRNQLTALVKNATPVTVHETGKAYTPKNDTVPPILGGIRFSQNHPYNIFCPMVHGGKAIVGCVPTACGQIMAHYRYPQHGTGSYAYLYKNTGTVISKDFSTVKMDWDKYFMEDYTLPCDTLAKQNISQLMTAISSSLGAEFGKEGTSAGYGNIKSSMVNFWGFAPSCRICKSSNTDTIIGLIRRELDNGRAAIVANDNHCYIADGSEGNFLHLNLGWGGFCNGYYRTRLCEEGSISYDFVPLPIDHVLTGLEPDNGKKLELTINVDTPNSLDTLMTDEQKLSVSSLTLTGTIGNNDVRLIRQMLGGNASYDYFAPCGRLQCLDLTGAEFQDDPEGFYYSEVAHGNAGSSWITSSTTGARACVKNYDYDKMDSISWASYKASGMDIREGEYTKYENGVCTTYYHTEPGIISPMMFRGCENLMKIRLPEKTKEICHNAFAQCTSLTDVLLPGSVSNVYDYAFAHTRLLKEVRYVQNTNANFSRNAFEGGYYGADFKRVPAE